MHLKLNRAQCVAFYWLAVNLPMESEFEIVDRTNEGVIIVQAHLPWDEIGMYRLPLEGGQERIEPVKPRSEPPKPENANV